MRLPWIGWKEISPELIEEKMRVNKLYHEAYVRLLDIAVEYADDPHERHDRADGVLCGLLIQLGAPDVVDAYEKVRGHDRT